MFFNQATACSEKVHVTAAINDIFNENLVSFYKVKHLFKGYIIIPKFLYLISLNLCMFVLLKKLNTSLPSSQGPISTSSHPHTLQSG